MRGIREKGVVVVIGREAYIRIVPADARGCAGCGACGAPERDGARRLPLAAARSLEPGTEVVVETSPVSLLAASLLLLLVPLLGLLLGAFLGRVFGPRMGLGPDGGSILGGIALLVGTYAAVAGYDRRVRRRSGSAGPRIVEILGAPPGALSHRTPSPPS